MPCSRYSVRGLIAAGVGRELRRQPDGAEIHLVDGHGREDSGALDAVTVKNGVDSTGELGISSTPSRLNS